MEGIVLDRKAEELKKQMNSLGLDKEIIENVLKTVQSTTKVEIEGNNIKAIMRPYRAPEFFIIENFPYIVLNTTNKVLYNLMYDLEGDAYHRMTSYLYQYWSRWVIGKASENLQIAANS